MKGKSLGPRRVVSACVGSISSLLIALLLASAIHLFVSTTALNLSPGVPHSNLALNIEIASTTQATRGNTSAAGTGANQAVDVLPAIHDAHLKKFTVARARFDFLKAIMIRRDIQFGMSSHSVNKELHCLEFENEKRTKQSSISDSCVAINSDSDGGLITRKRRPSWSQFALFTRDKESTNEYGCFSIRDYFQCCFTGFSSSYVLLLHAILLMWIWYYTTRMLYGSLKVTSDDMTMIKSPTAVQIFLLVPWLIRVAYVLVEHTISSLTVVDWDSVLLVLRLFSEGSSVNAESKRKTSKNYTALIGWKGIACTAACILCQSSFACTNIRNDMSEYPCIEYDAENSTFNLVCSFQWTDYRDCIILLKNERFEGNGYTIRLIGGFNPPSWEGLFEIEEPGWRGGPSSLEDAPVIQNLRMLDGQTSFKGGFIVRAEQKNFIVKYCSSTGIIEGTNDGDCGWGQWGSRSCGGGGICGHGCSGDILITYCSSSGEIRGSFSGGIAGRDLGSDGGADNTVTISHSFSTGNMQFGSGKGGICGLNAGGNSGGSLTIDHCYSVGNIRGRQSGGITGSHTARDGGHVSINNCYSLGDITDRWCGGITGSHAAINDGHLSITNSYSRGDITGSDVSYAGGICGAMTGEDSGTVVFTNVYASGRILGENAGGLIGIVSLYGRITITMCVYNGNSGNMMGSSDPGPFVTIEKTSGDLADITGTIYCYEDGEECWDSETVWVPIRDELPRLQNMPNSPSFASPEPFPSATPTGTLTSTATSTSSTTSTQTTTPSDTPTATRTSSQTASLTTTPSDTPTATGTPSQTASLTPTSTPSMSWTRSPTNSVTSTGSPTVSSSPTSSLIFTATRTSSSSPIATGSAASSATQSSTASRTAVSSLEPTGSASVPHSPSSRVSDLPLPSIPAHVTSSEMPGLSATASVSPSECCLHSGESAIQGTWEQSGPVVGLCFVGLFSLLVMYIGYKRLRNKRAQAAKPSCSDEALYAIQLGVNENDMQCSHNAKDKDHSVAENPLVRSHGIHHDGDDRSTRSTPKTAQHTGSLPFRLVDTKNSEPSRLSEIKVLSARRPDLRSSGRTNSFYQADAKIQIARVSDLDTSQMSAIDQTVIKLRQWKARLFAEPPPVVAVSLREESDLENLNKKASNESEHNLSKKLVSQLEFAATRRDSDHPKMSPEISR